MSLETTQASPNKGGGLPYKWKVLISVIFGIFMVILDTTIVNIAFRTLQEEFAAGVNESQWIISIYVLALGISTPLSGFLGDRFGMKRTYVTGLGIFILGSFLCGIAPSLWLLIAARTLQGFGGGIALPLGTALLFSAFPQRAGHGAGHLWHRHCHRAGAGPHSWAAIWLIWGCGVGSSLSTYPSAYSALAWDSGGCARRSASPISPLICGD
ncbi:MAG: MFS transporter [Caldilineaceae bacterium]